MSSHPEISTIKACLLYNIYILGHCFSIILLLSWYVFALNSTAELPAKTDYVIWGNKSTYLFSIAYKNLMISVCLLLLLLFVCSIIPPPPPKDTLLKHPGADCKYVVQYADIQYSGCAYFTEYLGYTVHFCFVIQWAKYISAVNMQAL